MRVLLVRLDGIGDAAVCAPLIAGLRAAGHTIGAVLTTRNAGLFAPGVFTAEHVLERIPWPAHGSTPESTERARASIAAGAYDVALIASEEPEAYALAAPIARRVGFTTGWLRPLKTLWVRRRVTRAVTRLQAAGRGGPHEAQVLFALGRGLVAEPAPTRDSAVLRALFTAAPLPDRQAGPVVFQAGAKWAASGVDDASVRAIVAALDARGLRVIAAPAEADAAAALLARPVESFGDPQSWVAALDAARAVVTTDTGAAHVAGMLGVPVVDVFPDAHFAAQAVRWHPWASDYTALPAAAACGGGGPGRIEKALDEF